MKNTWNYSIHGLRLQSMRQVRKYLTRLPVGHYEVVKQTRRRHWKGAGVIRITFQVARVAYVCPICMEAGMKLVRVHRTDPWESRVLIYREDGQYSRYIDPRSCRNPRCLKYQQERLENKLPDSGYAAWLKKGTVNTVPQVASAQA